MSQNYSKDPKAFGDIPKSSNIIIIILVSFSKLSYIHSQQYIFYVYMIMISLNKGNWNNYFNYRDAENQWGKP